MLASVGDTSTVCVLLFLIILVLCQIANKIGKEDSSGQN